MSDRLRKLVQVLKGSREGEKPVLLQFPNIDVEQIASDLEIDRRARENGTRNLPKADSSAEDVAESDIVAEVKQRTRKSLDDYRGQMDLYEGRIRRVLSSLDSLADIDSAGEAALADFNFQSINDRNQLNTAFRRMRDSEKEFTDFRLIHNLSRAPRVVTPLSRLVRFMVLGIFVISESILNGVMFAQSSEMGLIGGFAQAIMLSLLNVGGATIVAVYGIPRITHKAISQRVIGFISAVLFAIYTLSLNLFIGHYRDLFIANDGAVSAEHLLNAFLHQSLHFESGQSLVLVAIGIFLSILALIDASGLEDRYPGYSEVSELRDSTAAEYANQKKECLQRLIERRDEAMEEFRQIVQETRSLQLDLSLSLEGRARLHENYRSHLNHLGDCLVRLLRRYHEENLKVRTEAAPDRFNQRARIPSFLDEPQIPELHDLGESENKRITERMQFYISAIREKCEEVAESYHTVADSTLDKSVQNEEAS